jgi:hypothetical protein
MPEPTIADRLERMIVAKEDIDTAVTEKGGIVTKGLENSDDDIASIPNGGYAPNAVNFYDLDGVVLYSYTAEKFARLTEMPPNPDQTEHWLTAQGWNWTLADAKAYVAKYGALNIGQYYVTIDGKTSMKIRLQEGRVHPQLGLYMNGTADIDWGDESEHSTLTGKNFAYKYTDHVYPGAGEYIILITITGKARISGNGGNSFFCKHTVGSKTAGNESRIYSNSIIDVHLGNDIDIGSFAFFRCYSLEHVTIPNTITTIDGQAFRWCSTLSGIVIPHGVTSIGTSAFEGCYRMRYASISKTVTSIGNYAFSQCFGVSSLIFSEDMTSAGDYAFQDTGACEVLKVPGLQNISSSFALRNRMLIDFVVPSGVTKIGTSAFNQAYGIERITIPDTVTTIETSAFAECQALNFIEFSDNVTTLGESMFNNCTSLKAFRIPIHVTTIPKQSFYKCYALDHIEIPAEVTSIGAQAFDTCTGLMYIKFIGTTPPTLDNSNAFANITSDCKILVPTGTLETYKSASNYPDPTKYTYEEY